MKSPTLLPKPGVQAAKILAIYVALGAGWILLSDWLLARQLYTSQTYIYLQSLKGIFFVLVTGIGLYIAARRAFRFSRSFTERYRLLYDENPAMYFTVSEAGEILSVNAAAARDLYYSPDELVGKPFGELFHASERDAALKGMMSTFRERSTVMSGEYRKIRRDGSSFWTQDIVRAVPDEKGALVALVVCEDITSLKAAQERITRMNRLFSVSIAVHQMITRNRDKQRLFDEACRILTESGLLRMAWVGVLDPESDMVEPVASAGFIEGYLDATTISIQAAPHGRGPTGRAIRQGRSVICNDIANDSCMGPWREPALKRGYRSSAAFPLIVQGRVLGTLNVYAEEPGFFDDDVFRLLDELAGNVAFAANYVEEEARRIRAEEKVRETSERYQNLYDNAIVGLSCTRISDGTMIDCNKEMVRMFGYTDKDEFIREYSASDGYVNPEARKELLAQIEKTGEARNFDALFRRKDGSTFWLRSTVRSLPELGHLESVALDVTDEIVARDARMRLGAALDQVADMVVITDENAVIQYVNPAFERISGFTSKEAVGKHKKEIASDRYDDEFFRAVWGMVIGGQAWSGRLINRRSDGETYEVDATISPVRDAHGRITECVEVARDVTRQLELEEQLRQAQKMEAVGRLAGGVAHDFNNLLTVISGYAELLQVQIKADQSLEKPVAEIRKASAKAAEMVDQLLTFSRKSPMKKKSLNLNAVIGETESILRRIIGENIELTLATASDLWRTTAGASQIEQILLNLVINARDAMPDGGALRIETANVVLSEDFVEHMPGEVTVGNYVVLTVTDTGSGMDEETLSHIFEPFFTTKGDQGTGIGLATVYSVAKQHGGYVTCYSEPGEGTAFRVYLPATRQEPAVEERPQVEAELSEGKETVLVVENDQNILSVSAGMLRQYRYDVLQAASAEEALSLCEKRSSPIDLLVADVALPDMDGVELAHHLKEKWPGIAVLYMSGFASEAIVRRAILTEDISFIRKPYRLTSFLKKVQETLKARAR